MLSIRKGLQIGKYAAAAVLFSVLLSGCSILPTKKKTATDPTVNQIVVWSFEDEDVWKPIKRDFENQNKGMTLVYQKQIFDSIYENRVLNSALSTQKPDVWAMPNDWIYRHKEKLYPMPETLAKTINLGNQYVPAIKQSVNFDEKTYALSPSAEPLMIYYRDDLFSKASEEATKDLKDYEARKRIQSLLAEPPKTWSEFAEAVKLITKKNDSSIEISGAAIGTPNVLSAEDLLYLLMMQNETDLLSGNLKLAMFNLPKSTSTGVNDIPGKRALEFFASFADPKSPNYTWNDSLGNPLDAFGNGKVAMIFGYSNLQNILLQKYPNLRYRKAYVPQVSQETPKIVDFARFTAFGVSIISKNPAASWNLVNLLANVDADTYNSANRLYTAQKASSYDSSIINRSPGNPEKLSLATAKPLIKGRYPEEFNANIRSAIAAVNTGTQDAKSALDLAANNITEYLRKTDW